MGKQMAIRVDLIPKGPGKAQMVYQGEILGTSSEPLFTAARLLMNRGEAEAQDYIETYRDGMRCMRAKVGVAATKTVKEDRKGIRIGEFRPFAAPADTADLPTPRRAA
jgi:hypothetical protein